MKPIDEKDFELYLEIQENNEAVMKKEKKIDTAIKQIMAEDEE